MPVYLNNTATAATVGTTPLTWSHTVGSGPNRILLVALAVQSSTQPTVTSVTYNAKSMTKIRGDQGTTASLGSNETSWWIMVNPPIGAATVSAAATLGTLPDFAGHSITLYGAVQSTTVDSQGTSTDSTIGGTKTVSVTTVADQCWVLCIGDYMTDGVSQSTLTSGQTLRSTQPMSLGFNGVSTMEDNNVGLTPPGTQAMTFTAGGGSGAGLALFTGSAIAIAPAIGKFMPRNIIRPRPFKPGSAR